VPESTAVGDPPAGVTLLATALDSDAASGSSVQVVTQSGSRVGDVAERTGLSVRAIHYYDQIGLVTPSVRTDGGHRIYSDDDIERLCAVALLRLAGQSTGEIGACLAGPDWTFPTSSTAKWHGWIDS